MNEQLTVRQQVALALLVSMLGAECQKRAFETNSCDPRRTLLIDYAYIWADSFLESGKVEDESRTDSR